MRKIAVIGCGAMGGAFVRQLSSSAALFLYDRETQRAEKLAKECGATRCQTVHEALDQAETVILAIKPKDLPSFAKEAGAPLKGKQIISLLSGTSLSTLRHYFPTAFPIRIMPNLALICAQGIIGIAEESIAAQEEKAAIEALFHGMGLILWLPEKNIEALAALTSSGLGFICAMIEAMSEGGVFLGFPPHVSRELVLQTFQGALSLLQQTKLHPAELKAQVSSPGGTTIAGLRVFEQKGVRSGIFETLVACWERGLQVEHETGVK